VGQSGDVAPVGVDEALERGEVHIHGTRCSRSV